MGSGRHPPKLFIFKFYARLYLAPWFLLFTAFSAGVILNPGSVAVSPGQLYNTHHAACVLSPGSLFSLACSAVCSLGDPDVRPEPKPLIHRSTRKLGSDFDGSF